MPPKQEKVFILFSVRDDAKFLSHRETQTIWQRAFVRAAIPISYSQGFNPRIKMSLPLPRNVGVASECELLVFSVSEHMEMDDLQNRLAGQLPAGIGFIRSGYLPAKEKVLPCEASYNFYPYANVNVEELREKIEELNETNEYVAERGLRGRHKARSLNIKENIKKLEYRGNVIELTMEFSQTVTARLDEIARAIGLDLTNDIEHVTRVATRYEGTINDVLSL